LRSTHKIQLQVLAWYAEFLLEIDLEVLHRKTGARLNIKITFIYVHFDPGARRSNFKFQQLSSWNTHQGGS
jgi:hypothetical protein